MSEVIQFVENFNAREHAYHLVFLTEPDQAKFWAATTDLQEGLARNWFPERYRGREFMYMGFKQFQLDNAAERALLAIEAFEHPRYGHVYRAYVGNIDKQLDSHQSLHVRRYVTHFRVEEDARGSKLFVPDPEGAPMIFAEEDGCSACAMTGKADKDLQGVPVALPCAECDGQGWKSPGTDVPDLGKPVEVRALRRPLNRRSQEAWALMFPEGDGLQG